MNRIIKTELVNNRLNQCFKTIIYREIKRTSELTSIKAKELSVNVNANEELLDQVKNQTQIRANDSSKYNLKYLIPTIKLKDDDKLAEEHTNHDLFFESNLRPFIYSLVNSNLDDEALKTIEFYENKKSSLTNLGPTISLRLINILAKKYALNSNLNGVENCLNLINRLNFKPDLVFYSYHLYVLAKVNHQSEINRILSQIQKRQLNLDDLFENSFLNSEQRSALINYLSNFGLELNSRSYKHSEYNTKLLDDYQNSKRAVFSPLEGVRFNDDLFNEQLNNEKDIFVKLDSAFKVPKNQNYEKLINEIASDWKKRLRKALDQNMKLMKIQNENDSRINIYPFLNSFDRDKLSDFLVEFLIELTKSKYPADSKFLTSQIGHLLENQYLSAIKLKNFKHLKLIYRNYFNYINDKNKFSQANSRQFCKEIFLDLDLYNQEFNEMVWSSKIRKDIGNHVIQICIETLKFNQNLLKPKHKTRLVPALFKTTQFEKGVRNDVISPNIILNKISSTLTNYSFFSAKELPMLIPPLPWSSPYGFPFLISKIFLVIEPNVVYERKIAEKLRDFNINGVLDSINYTSLTPWKINNDILDLLNKIFQSGGDYKLDLPHHHTKMPEIPKKEADEDMKSYKKRTFELKKQNKEMYALWCEMNYKLSIANYVR